MLGGAAFNVGLFARAESLRTLASSKVVFVVGGVLRGFRWLQIPVRHKTQQSASFDLAETAWISRNFVQPCALKVVSSSRHDRKSND